MENIWSKCYHAVKTAIKHSVKLTDRQTSGVEGKNFVDMELVGTSLHRSNTRREKESTEEKILKMEISRYIVKRLATLFSNVHEMTRENTMTQKE